MLDKTAIRNNKKFLVSCHDPYMANIFIEECQAAYENYKTILCFDKIGRAHV